LIKIGQFLGKKILALLMEKRKTSQVTKRSFSGDSDGSNSTGILVFYDFFCVWKTITNGE